MQSVLTLDANGIAAAFADATIFLSGLLILVVLLISSQGAATEPAR
jgi:hypothetical protein